MKKQVTTVKRASKPKPAEALADAPAAATKPPTRTRSSPKTVGATVPPPPAPEASTGSLTIVAARSDIGYGNTLFLRGSGPGLSWDVGTPMVCIGKDVWVLELLGATRPVCCKFLINDQHWSAGPDFIIDPGAQLEVTPLF